MIILHEPTEQAWEGFLQGEQSETLPLPLLRSWQRAREAGALGRKPAFVERNQLQDPQGLHESMRRHALGVLDRLVASLARSGYVAILADAQGFVLDRRGGGEFLSTAQRAQLVEGACWSEAARGTNAIGTALAELTPVIVQGRAHLHAANHGLVCYARPLRDPTGRICGVLDLTSHALAADPLAATALVAAAASVEDSWRHEAFSSRQGGLHALESMVERCRDPAALIIAGGELRTLNAAMLAQLPDVRTAPRSIEALCGMTWDQLAWLEEGQHAQPRPAGALPAARELIVEWVLDGAGTPCAALLICPLRRVEAPVAGNAFAALLGDDPAQQEAISLARRFAPTTLPVLILSETGTGKELLARALHDASPRARRPFVAVNCATLSGALLSSQLFGYAPGAFTDARAEGSPGLVGAADGGTLFLDEIAELPPTAQAALLRFLEDGAYQRIGDAQTRRADVRLIAATCDGLDQAVASGRFRSDLYYRLRGALLTLPPLRARADLVQLAHQLLAREAAPGSAPPILSSAAQRALAAHPWPGNIRELRQCLRVALVLADGAPTISPHHLQLIPTPAPAAPPTDAEDPMMVAIREAGGNVSEAARRLGVARSTLYRRLKSP